MYYNCKWLQHGMEFSMNAIRACCYGGNEGGGRPVLYDEYHGEFLDKADLFSRKRAMRNIQKEGQTVKACVGCGFLAERDWDDSDYIDNIVLNHWSHCNAKCIYCYTAENKQFYNGWKPYQVLPVLQNMLEQGILKEKAYVNFGGGEPTILNEFEDLLDFFIKNNARHIDILSSGIKYSQAIENGIRVGKVFTVLSPDSGTPETYLRIKQVPCFEKVWENISKYVQAQTDGISHVRTKFIFIPGINDTVSEVEKWLDLNRQIGIRDVLIDIETSWFIANRNNITAHIYDLIQFAKDYSASLKINCWECVNVALALKNKPDFMNKQS